VEDRHQSRLERRLNKAQRHAFILAQVENPTIPPHDPRWNDLSSLAPFSISTEDYDELGEIRLIGASGVVVEVFLI
jgi:hypothetical protein